MILATSALHLLWLLHPPSQPRPAPQMIFSTSLKSHHPGLLLRRLRLQPQRPHRPQISIQPSTSLHLLLLHKPCRNQQHKLNQFLPTASPISRTTMMLGVLVMHGPLLNLPQPQQLQSLHLLLLPGIHRSRCPLTSLLGAVHLLLPIPNHRRLGVVLVAPRSLLQKLRRMKTSAAGAALRLSPLQQAILNLYKTSLLVVEGVLAVLVRICSLMYGSEFSKYEGGKWTACTHQRAYMRGYGRPDAS